MRLILLLLVVEFAALGCCEEGDNQNIFCYAGQFTTNQYGDRDMVDPMRFVRAHSCFTYFRSDCAISFAVKPSTVKFITSIECYTSGCNRNLVSQLEQLRMNNSEVHQTCNRSITEVIERERERKSNQVFCYSGKLSDAEGKINTQNLRIRIAGTECYVRIKKDCTISLSDVEQDHFDEYERAIACKSDGCNYNVKSVMEKWGDYKRDLYDRCKEKFKNAFENKEPAPALKSNLQCIVNKFPKKSRNSEWLPMVCFYIHKNDKNKEIGEFRPYCVIRFSSECDLDFSFDFVELGEIDTCQKQNGDIVCNCNSGDYCNMDFEKRASEASQVAGFEFIKGCDYSGYRFPHPERFKDTVDTIKATTVLPKGGAVVSKSPHQNNDMPNQHQMYASSSSSTVVSFVLLLLMI